MPRRFDDARRAFETAMAAGGDAEPDVLLAYSRHLLYLDRASEAVLEAFKNGGSTTPDAEH